MRSPPPFDRGWSHRCGAPLTLSLAGWQSLRITNRLRRSPLSGPRCCLSASCGPPALRACGPSFSIAACGCSEFRAGAVLVVLRTERAHATFDSGALHPLAAGLRPTIKLAACGFESPGWLSPVCAPFYLSIEAGVTSPCSHSGSQADRSASPEVCIRLAAGAIAVKVVLRTERAHALFDSMLQACGPKLSSRLAGSRQSTLFSTFR